MANKDKTSMSIYVDVETARRFRALCALRGISQGDLIKKMVDVQWPIAALGPIPSQREGDGE